MAAGAMTVVTGTAVVMAAPSRTCVSVVALIARISLLAGSWIVLYGARSQRTLRRDALSGAR
jgi:hypothetical protein